MILTYKYRLKGKRAVRQLRRFSWAVNQVWNYCVATQREAQRRYKNGSKAKWPSHFDLANLTKGTSIDLGVNSKSIAGVCEQFSKSRDQHKKCPRFRKSSGSKRSLGWIPFPSDGRQLDSNSITYLGNKYRFFGAERRPLPAIVKGGSFVEDSLGRWWVALHVEVGDLQSADSGQVGIDLGLKTLATCSDGVKIENPRSYRQLEQKLAIAQRAGRKRQAKRIHIKIANGRRDHLHKESEKIARQYSLVAVGDVSSSKLAKTRFAKSVLDAGWSTFKDFLRYKVSRHGGTYLEVDERFTSQRCSSCGEVPRSSPRGMGALGIREWMCSSCGAIHDRDVNAAKNILSLALSAQRPAEDSRDSVERQVAYGR